jgi:hypothetical protein
MVVNILQHTPLWVWVLFVALIALGWSQARPREVSRARAIVLPVLLIALSLVGVVSAFGLFPLALGMWVAGFGASLWLAGDAMAVRGVAWSSASGRLQLPGSWLPLTLIVSLFVLKYGAGVCLAVNPGLAANALFASLCSVAYGTFAGLFWGRARSLRGVARSGTVRQPA